jgi:hypothetical protein
LAIFQCVNGVLQYTVWEGVGGDVKVGGPPFGGVGILGGCIGSDGGDQKGIEGIVGIAGTGNDGFFGLCPGKPNPPPFDFSTFLQNSSAKIMAAVIDEHIHPLR